MVNLINLLSQINTAWLVFNKADQLKRFAPFSYLNHSFILSLNVKACIRFILFLQISLCFFVCQELCWMRGLCISFTSCFLFPVGGGSEKVWGLGWLKKFRTGERLPIWRVTFAGGGQYPITCHGFMSTISYGNQPISFHSNPID